MFCGEVRDSGVTGFHNWVQAYEEEKISAFEYRYNLEYCEVSQDKHSSIKLRIPSRVFLKAYLVQGLKKYHVSSPLNVGMLFRYLVHEYDT